MVSDVLKNPIALAVGALALVVLTSSSLSIVPETSQAIITAFGEPKRIVNKYKKDERFGATNAGLTFHIPFVEKIQFIDKRVLSVQMAPQEVLSTDQLQVLVNAFAPLPDFPIR